MGLFKKAAKNSFSPILDAFSKTERYHTLKPVGEGGIAKITGIFDSRLNRVAALKELKEESLGNQDLVRSFITEVRLTSFLDHPGVLPIFDTFTDADGKPCYTMKLFEGKNLAAMLADYPPDYCHTMAAVTKTLEIFTKICETLAYVHDRGVLHLDLKPENIMQGKYGEIAIMDWGNALLYDSQHYRGRLEQFGVVPEQAELAPERDGIILGTPKYMSPEQTTMPRRSLTPASDIFSTGIILYELLTKTHPFPAEDLEGLLHQIRHGVAQPVHEINANVPRRLSAICATMLEKSPARRYRDFHQILDDLIDLKNAGNTFQTIAYQQGEVIFSEGDPGDYAFIILSGKVSIVKKAGSVKTVLATLERDEIVGELAILNRLPRTATAIAVEPTVVRIMNRETIEKELEKLNPWVGGMITCLSRRFNDLNEKLVSLAGKRNA